MLLPLMKKTPPTGRMQLESGYGDVCGLLAERRLVDYNEALIHLLLNYYDQVSFQFYH